MDKETGDKLETIKLNWIKYREQYDKFMEWKNYGDPRPIESPPSVPNSEYIKTVGYLLTVIVDLDYRLTKELCKAE